jgi:membrane protein YqaA with SNARE-associated domain
VGRIRTLLTAWGPWGIFAAALIESAGVPSPSGTDALILLVTLARPDSALLCAALAVIGSVIGSAIFHGIVAKGGEKLLDQRTSSPRGRMLRTWFQRYGLASVFVCALVPFPFMPLKVMALCACALGVSRTRYLGTMLAARIPRYGAIAYLGAHLGSDAQGWLKAHIWHMGLGSLALFAALYLLLKASEQRSPQHTPGSL